MMRRAAVGLMILGVSGVAAGAQQPSRPCTLVLDDAGASRSNELRPGVVHTFGWGGVTGHCKGEQTTMKSDSAAWYGDLDRLDLVGHAVFQDSLVRLDADRAVYFLRDQRLEAYGKVTLLNRKTSSRLSGPNLTYYRVAGARDTSELVATGHPRAHYFAESDSGTGEPYVINADRMRFRGNSRAWAGGGVTVERTDFSAKADSAELQMGAVAGGGFLIGHAEARGGDSAGYVLTGRTIRYKMEKNNLRWVQARGLADATSAEWRLVADTVEFDIVSGKVGGGRAWGDSTRPHAASRTYTISGDSLALDSPGQRLTELRAFGRGHATSAMDSSARAAGADWMSGDTLVARFDSTLFGKSTLSKLTARGTAKAFYHVPDPKHPTTPGITYSRGKEIAARFTPLGLDRVDVVGDGDGVYLEPGAPVAPPVPAASTAAVLPKAPVQP